MSLAFIALGSNIGDGRKNLVEAWTMLGNKRGITVLALSNPYLSKPVMKPEWQRNSEILAGQWFTNAVGVFETSLEPHALLEVTRSIEDTLGRDRNVTVNRTIDLDLLYYDNLVLGDENLTLPHPEMHKRHFVLLPLAEIVPDRVHPVNGLSTSGMLRSLPFADTNEILRASWDNEELDK